jgi:hypothetical protein
VVAQRRCPGEFSAFGSRPGGFIGEVMDGLDMNNPAHRVLATRMQEQADQVRSMFTHEDFKRGNGDPAKMGRHIPRCRAWPRRRWRSATSSTTPPPRSTPSMATLNPASSKAAA